MLILDLLERHKKIHHDNIQSVHREILAELRNYGALPTIATSLNVLHNDWGDRLTHLRSAPWLTLLIVKWVLEDTRIQLHGKEPPVELIDKLRQRLWDCTGAEHLSKPPANIRLMLRSLIYVQLEFQRKADFSFLRLPALVAATDNSSVARRMFASELGVTPEQFIDVTFALLGALNSRPVGFDRDFLAPLNRGYAVALNKLLALYSTPVEDLRRERIKTSQGRRASQRELYEFPFVKQHPLLKLDGDKYVSWHPVTFIRGIEDAVHIRLSKRGEEYTNVYGRLFEDYVKDLANSACERTFTEGAIWKRLGRQSPAVEAVIPCEVSNVLVEAKFSLSKDDILLTDSEDSLFNKCKNIRRGIAQAWAFLGRAQKAPEAFPECANLHQNYLLVVTNRELLLGGGPFLSQLFPDRPMHPEEDGLIDSLPISNVFIISITEYERLIQAVVAEGVRLDEVLQDAAERSDDVRTSSLFLSDALNGKVERWSLTPLLQSACDASEFRLKDALGGDQQT